MSFNCPSFKKLFYCHITTPCVLYEFCKEKFSISLKRTKIFSMIKVIVPPSIQNSFKNDNKIDNKTIIRQYMYVYEKKNSKWHNDDLKTNCMIETILIKY